MDFEANYEISRTVDFIRTGNFTKVALQFPDELLKDSTRVAKALRSELGKGVRLYVMADTAYGSCCVDEIGASHVDADCVVHYGHACMSPTSTLPALFVFGKASIDVNACAESLRHCLSTASKHIVVLYGLEYAHALENLKTVVAELLQFSVSNSSVHFAEVACSSINPSGDKMTEKEQLYSHNGVSDIEEVHKYANGNSSLISVDCNKLEPCTKYSLGGLIWNMPVDHKMEDYLLFWIGSENPAFTNVVLTFNNCELVRYDAEQSNLLKDFAYQRRILKRRYYLVEKAKDANIVGILVGTLGVAGYLCIIQQMKELIERAGKKSYTFVMGRPNSAKLANFPECDVFVYVSCAQTALLDSKEFLAPVITPFEAVLAFNRLQREHPHAFIQVLWDGTVLDFSVEQHTPPSRHVSSGLESLRGSKWTGEYVINFQDLTASPTSEVVNDTEEARFSFIQGGYVEDIQPLENGEHKETSLALAEATEKALNLKNQCTDSVLFKGKARSGAEFFAARSFQGLNMQYENPLPQSYVIGRTGKASGYEDEK